MGVFLVHIGSSIDGDAAVAGLRCATTVAADVKRDTTVPLQPQATYGADVSFPVHDGFSDATTEESSEQQ